MNREKFDEHTQSSAFLPPRELWLHDPYVDGLLPTPVDPDRKLVDVDRLIEQMKATIAPGYDWASSFSDKHHVQWPERWYEKGPDLKAVPHVFRNLAISQVVVPRVFHNWVHLVTEPPESPTEEVMRYRIGAQSVAISLFREVKHSKITARRRGLGEDGLEELLTRRFDDFAEKYEEGKQIPEPFRLINYEQYPLKTIDDMVKIGTRLGKFAIISSVTSRLRRPIAA